MIKNKIWKKINYMPNYLISNFGDVINIKTNKTLKHQIKKGYHHAIDKGLWQNVFKASQKTNESRKIKCKAVNKSTGEVIYFNSISEAERYFNDRHICDVLKGKRNTVHGYIMQYV